jgi:hypothetical protein
MKDQDFEAFMADPTKQINRDIIWHEDDDHSPGMEFRVVISSQARYPIFVMGRCNLAAQKLSYALAHPSFGRIYALDMGKGHKNPLGNRVGRKHKHRWTEQFRDKKAYEPEDITASVSDPIAVWEQFCHEAVITHNGAMYFQSSLQRETF